MRWLNEKISLPCLEADVVFLLVGGLKFPFCRGQVRFESQFCKLILCQVVRVIFGGSRAIKGCEVGDCGMGSGSLNSKYICLPGPGDISKTLYAKEKFFTSYIVKDINLFRKLHKRRRIANMSGVGFPKQLTVSLLRLRGLTQHK